jgi:hypothetical protein
MKEVIPRVYLAPDLQSPNVEAIAHAY